MSDIKKKSNYMTYLYMFLIVFIPFRELIGMYINSFLKFIPDLIIGLTFIILFFKKKIINNFCKEDIFLLLFLVVAAISTLILNKNGIIVYGLEVRSMFLYYIFYYTTKNIKDLNIDYKKILNVLKVVVFIISIFAITEKIFNKEILFPIEWAKSIEYRDNFSRVYSVFNNPNTFGIFITFSFFIIFYFDLILKKFKSSKHIYVLLLVNLWLSASRSSFIVFIIFLLFAIKYIISNKEYISKLSIILLTTVVLIFGIEKISDYYFINYSKDYFSELNKQNISVPNNSSTIVPNNPDTNIPINPDIENSSKPNENIAGNLNQEVEDVTKDEDIKKREEGLFIYRLLNAFSNKTINQSIKSGRIGKVLKGLEIFAENPLFGTGFGTYGDSASLMIYPEEIYEKYELEEGFYADNEYIKVLVETGIVGSVSLLLFVICLLISYKANIFKCSVIICFLVLCLFMNAFEIQILTFMLGLFLILPDIKKENNN